MEDIYLNQRLNSIALRIIALSASKRSQLWDEIKLTIERDELNLLQKKIYEQEQIKALFDDPKKMPLSHAQFLFWLLELFSGHSKNEMTSSMIEGQLDRAKLEHILNELQNEFDVFSFQIPRWVPYAKKVHSKKLELVTYVIDPLQSVEKQLNDINIKLAGIDLLVLKQNLFACLVQLSEKKAILHLVISHKSIDGKSKLLIWDYLGRKYHNQNTSPYVSFRNYIYTEKSYYSGLDLELQKKFIKNYGHLSPCHIKKELIDNKNTIKTAINCSIDKNAVKKLQNYASNNDYRFEELIISAVIKALHPFCTHKKVLIQLASQPFFNKHYSHIMGPCLNDRVFALQYSETSMEPLRQLVREENRNSINYGNFPYSAALGWLYYHKHPKLAAGISKWLRLMSHMTKFTAISQAIANAYAGLLCYNFLDNRNCESPMLSFNFRNALIDQIACNQGSNQDVTFSPYTKPLYTFSKYYISIIIDASPEGGVLINIGSYLREEVDKQIMDATLKYLNEL